MKPNGEARGWAGAVLHGLELVAYPAIAGGAFGLLALGVVTWLPALAALAAALDRWRRDGDTRVFTGVLAAFPGYWRALWRHALVLGFGSPRRGLALLAALVLAPVVALPLAVGPLLFGPSIPVLCGLALLDRADPSHGVDASS